MQNIDIFQRLHLGETVPFSDPEYYKIFELASQTMKLSAELNTSADDTYNRKILSKIFANNIGVNTSILQPIHINIGKFTTIGNNVFINHDCTFLGIGGITIEDDVLIGPKASLITEGHPIKPNERKALLTKPILIKRNAWIGAGAIILPGVTIGENSIIAAGAVVANDVQSNVIVGGIPAIVIKTID